MKATTKHTIQKGIFLAQCEHVIYFLIVNYMKVLVAGCYLLQLYQLLK